MTDIQNLLNDPEHKTLAGKLARKTMFVFIGAWLVMVLTAGLDAGILAGIVFLAIGCVMMPIAVTVPSFVLQVKHPQRRTLINFLDVLATLMITRALYMSLLVG